MKFYQAVIEAVEWRIVALVVTILYMWFSGLPFGHATLAALGLQTILFFVQSVFIYFKSR